MDANERNEVLRLVDERIDDVKHLVDSSISHVNTRIDDLIRRVDTVDQKLVVLSSRVDRFESNLNRAFYTLIATLVTSLISIVLALVHDPPPYLSVMAMSASVVFLTVSLYLIAKAMSAIAHRCSNNAMRSPQHT